MVGTLSGVDERMSIFDEVNLSVSRPSCHGRIRNEEDDDEGILPHSGEMEKDSNFFFEQVLNPTGPQSRYGHQGRYNIADITFGDYYITELMSV